MIELVVEEYCQNCLDFDPCVEKMHIGYEELVTNVMCENRDRCNKMYERIKSQLVKQNECK